MSTIKQYVNSFLNWLLLSSNDPSQASLTFKGILLGGIPVIMSIVGFTHLAVSQDMVSTIINEVALIVQDGLFVVAACMAFYGALRKLFNGVLSVWNAIHGN